MNKLELQTEALSCQQRRLNHVAVSRGAELPTEALAALCTAAIEAKGGGGSGGACVETE